MAMRMRNMSVVFTALLLCVLFLTGCGKTVLPDFAGQTEAAAETFLLEAELVIERVTEHSLTVPAGSVLSQDPSPGTKVKKETTVTVTVSAGPRILPVPSVLGVPVEEAQKTLFDAGFQAQTVEVFSDDVEKGLVISQSVAADQTAAEGTAVSLAVSKGQDLVEVPAVAGLPVADGKEILAKADFRLEILHTYSDTMDRDAIVSCDPAAGEMVKRGSVVAVTVSDGVEMLTVPHVVGMDRQQAEMVVESIGFAVTVVSECSDTIPKETLISQAPASNSLLPRGGTVTLTVSAGIEQVQVPSVVGMTRAEAEDTLKRGKLLPEGSEEHSAAVPAGTAIRQSISQGTIVDKGTAVHVVYSKGPKYVRVPDVTKMTESGAKSVITSAGLRVTVEYVNSSTVSKGTVMQQAPAAGGTLQEGSVVELLVSLGKEQVKVPNVVGMPSVDATNALRAAGLTVTRIFGGSDDYARDMVILQSVSAGSFVDVGATVKITVCNGSATVIAPYAVGKDQQQAEIVVRGAGLTPTISLICSDTVREGLVISQSVAEGTRVARSSTMELCISAGPANKIGTTMSNALERGTVAVLGDWVYFTNYNRDFYLYRMRMDGTQKQLVLQEQVTNLNIVGDWIYYCSMKQTGGRYDGLCKVRLDGTQRTQLRTGSYNWLYAEGDWLYFSERKLGGKIERIKTDGTQHSVLCSETCAEPVVLGDRIFYHTENRGDIYSMNKDGSDRKLLMTNSAGGSLYEMTATGGYIYALRNTQILRIDPESGTHRSHQVGYNETVSYLAANDGWIYYVKFDFSNGNERAFLYRMKGDFTGEMKVCDLSNGKYTNFYISFAGDWVFFPNPGDNRYMYRVRLDGTDLQRVYN